MKTLVAVLIIEDNDRKEQWKNCGALVYDAKHQIGTMFTDDGATVVLGRYKGVILNELGMRMEMAGPVDVDRLIETCRCERHAAQCPRPLRGDGVGQAAAAEDHLRGDGQ